jgi:exodeoxyribonuclease V beta subunit
LDDYKNSNVEEAMNDNNYHLQYLIYTMASRLYLKNRISDFDYNKQFGGVIYLFLRGIRTGSENGIFTRVPSETILDNIENLIHHKTV